MRRLLLLFLVTHHIFWLLPTSRINIESLRWLRALQTLRSSLSISSTPPSISFIIPSPGLSTDNLNLRFRSQVDNTIRSLFGPISSSPPLFQTPIQRPAIVAPSIPSGKPNREQALQSKRFRQSSQSIVQTVRLRPSSSVPNFLEPWRVHLVSVQTILSTRFTSAIISPNAAIIRIFWDELLPALAESAVRSYADNRPAGIYDDHIHRLHAQNALQLVRSNVPDHVFQQLEPALLDQLEAIWTRSGRRRCNAISITSRPCIHSFHKVPGLAITLPSACGEIAEKRHSSGYSSLHSCSCSAAQVTFPDPFDLAEAEPDSSIQPCCKSSMISTDLISWRIHEIDHERPLPVTYEWFIDRDDSVLIALEFECDSGHRFFHNMRDPVTRFLQNSTTIIREAFPPSDIPITLKCHECRYVSKVATARLRHVYVDATNTRNSIRFRPKISVRCRRPDYHLKASEEARDPHDFIETGHDAQIQIPLPKKSRIAIAIPFAFPSSQDDHLAYLLPLSHQIVISSGILFKSPDNADVR